MIIKLTSAVRKPVPSAPDKIIWVNTRHFLKMGHQIGPAPQGEQDPYIYPHTAITMLGSPDMVVLETPDQVAALANRAVVDNG